MDTGVRNASFEPVRILPSRYPCPNLTDNKTAVQERIHCCDDNNHYH